MFEHFSDQLPLAAPGLVLLAVLFLLLILPAVLRALIPGSRAERAAGFIGSLCGIPSRLLSRLHTGDVRMYVIWIILGVVLLAALAMAAAGIEPSDAI